MLICKLCGDKHAKLAKSHITPLGFFAGIDTKAVLQSVGESGGRKLQSAIYDREILCHKCEKDIMGPLDDYGIKIFRDKKVSQNVQFRNGKASIYIYEKIDVRKTKAFIASILWRISVSKQKEIKNVTIGHANLRKIKVDLRRRDATFDYIDAVACFLTNKLHQGFFVPYRRKFYPKDRRRDKVPAKGMVIGFPNIVIFASFGMRRNPYRGYYTLEKDLTGLAHPIQVSTGLNDTGNGYSYMVLEQDKSDVIEESMFKLLEASLK